MEGKNLRLSKEVGRIVIKLGGKSLSKGERIKKLAGRISCELKKGRQVVVVVSAIGKTTDILLEQSLRACGRIISPKDLDEILAMGERTSVRMFAAALRAFRVKTEFLDPADRDWPIITDENFGDANPLIDECVFRIQGVLEPLLSKGIVPVLPGFIGKTLGGEITTLGRGGSDTTAFLVAKAIGADVVILVTDVRGIMSADPKFVPNSRRIEKIDVRKLMNLCDLGSKFLHRKALKFVDGSFKVKIVNYESERFDDQGTVIEGTVSQDNVPAENKLLAAITILTENSANNPEIVFNVLEKVRRNKIQNLMLLGDADSFILYVPDEEAEKAIKILHLNTTIRDRIISLALKRGLVWTKIFGVEGENLQREIELKIEQLRKDGKELFGILTIASNLHILAEKSN